MTHENTSSPRREMSPFDRWAGAVSVIGTLLLAGFALSNAGPWGLGVESFALVVISTTGFALLTRALRSGRTGARSAALIMLIGVIVNGVARMALAHGLLIPLEIPLALFALSRSGRSETAPVGRREALAIAGLLVAIAAPFVASGAGLRF